VYQGMSTLETASYAVPFLLELRAARTPSSALMVADSRFNSASVLLRLPDHLAHLNAKKCSWRLRHVAERGERRLCRSRGFLSVEKPE